MRFREPARTSRRRNPRILIASLLVVVAALAAGLGYRLLVSSASRAASPINVPRSEQPGAALTPGPASPQTGDPEDRGLAPPRSPTRPRQPASRRTGTTAPRGADPRDKDPHGALSEADGAISDGTTVFDDEVPGVAKLNPAFLGALRHAATDAADEGVKLYLNSGWRSPQYEEQLLREAISKYGSEEEAARWVATPNTSPHVSGDAVDIGSSDATAWLSEHGTKYGLCQIYSNEPWHYELRPQAIDHGCPAKYADPTHDPRMR